jgi:hypothetical protein
VSNRNGGPAFPRASNRPYGDHGYDGMTLRDYFAAKALPAALAEFYAPPNHSREVWMDHDDLAQHVYSVADAMLKARAK